MDNFDPYNVLLAIATNVLLMTAFVLQRHILNVIWMKRDRLTVFTMARTVRKSQIVSFSQLSEMSFGLVFII